MKIEKSSDGMIRITGSSARVKEHIEQLVVGYIRFGNAGIDAKRNDKGYIVHLCTMNEERRFVDLALTRQHLEQMGDYVREFLKEETA